MQPLIYEIFDRVEQRWLGYVIAISATAACNIVRADRAALRQRGRLFASPIDVTLLDPL